MCIALLSNTNHVGTSVVSRVWSDRVVGGPGENELPGPPTAFLHAQIVGSERWGFIIVSTEPETTRWGLGLLELLLRGALVTISTPLFCW